MKLEKSNFRVSAAVFIYLVNCPDNCFYCTVAAGRKIECYVLHLAAYIYLVIYISICCYCNADVARKIKL
jgi:hypothetical protein